MAATFSEPSPRREHYSALVDGEICVWGGRTKDFSRDKEVLAASVHSFNPVLESWAENKPSGTPPPGVYLGACASAGHHLYVYGGLDGSKYYNTLHQLDSYQVMDMEAALQ